MERLTKWEDDSITYNEKREFECGEYCDRCSQGAGNCKTVENMIKKLTTYEDLEEQGLLVKLPCKVGDIMFRINKDAKNPIIELTVTQIDITRRSYNLEVIDRDYGELMCFKNDIGKTIFPTREEAEKKLEEIKNE